MSIELADEALTMAQQAEAEDPAVAAVLPRLRASVERARGEMERFERHLREEVLPRSEGEGRLGARLFAERMRHTMRSDELTPERILEQAERDYGAVRAEMVRIATELWPTWFPGTELPADEQRLVRGVLDAISADHPPSDELLEFCREELERVEAFCRERDLIGLAAEPLEIRWTPTFMRSFGGAMLNSAGPLEPNEKTFFAITPVPEDWPDERKESYLREDNARMLRLLTIHEAVPGHYLQGVYSNRATSLLRTIFGSGLFHEGWAVYVTQVMMDVGYGAEDPSLLLIHWKFYLRSITNAIIDARIHVPWDDRGGGGQPDGRWWLPGGGRGARQVRPGAPVVDAAVDVLHGFGGVLGHRARGAPAGRRGIRLIRAEPTRSLSRASSGATARRRASLSAAPREPDRAWGAATSLLRRILSSS